MKLSQNATRASKGKAAEAFACSHLQKNGLRLIEKNFRCRSGEIDLIMQHDNALVFIEVRYRKNQDFGGAKASVTLSKQRKIKTTARYYMQQKGREFYARFDVVAICGEEQDLQYEWIQNAF